MAASRAGKADLSLGGFRKRFSLFNVSNDIGGVEETMTEVVALRLTKHKCNLFCQRMLKFFLTVLARMLPGNMVLPAEALTLHIIPSSPRIVKRMINTEESI